MKQKQDCHGMSFMSCHTREHHPLDGSLFKPLELYYDNECSYLVRNRF